MKLINVIAIGLLAVTGIAGAMDPVWTIFYQQKGADGSFNGVQSPVIADRQEFISYLEGIASDQNKKFYLEADGKTVKGIHAGIWHEFQMITTQTDPVISWDFVGTGEFRYLVTYTKDGTTKTEEKTKEQLEELKNDLAVSVSGNKPFWAERQNAIRTVTPGTTSTRIIIQTP